MVLLTWYIDAMEMVRLHFPGSSVEPLHLGEKTHMIGLREGLPGPVSEPSDALLTLSARHQGIWMNVSTTPARIHVNGRRVHRIALLRSGDVIHVDHAQLHLSSPPRVEPQTSATVPSPPLEGDPRLVLRALGGPDHGRCFTLNRLRLIGRSRKADIRVDDPACGERHAWLELHEGRLWLRLIGASGQAVVNGQAVHETVLHAGDQLAFSPRHRFVVEAPQVSMSVLRTPDAAIPAAVALPSSTSRPLRSLIWLLATAMLLAAALAGVLLLGAT